MIDKYYVEIYDFIHEVLVDDIKLYKMLLKENKDWVLELGCGTGRVMMPLLEDGFNVVGLDIADNRGPAPMFNHSTSTPGGGWLDDNRLL